jgi:hypothetical protein
VITFCLRCLTPCEVRGPSPRLKHTQVVLVAAEDDRGLCASCAVHWWLHTVDGIRWALASSGPGMLSMPALQHMLAPLLAQMHPDLGAVDWARMLDQWDLSWPLDWALPGDTDHG